MVGQAVGDHFRRERDCAYDSVVVLEAGGPGQTRRTAWRRWSMPSSGSVARSASDRLHRFDVGDTTFADEAVTDFLRDTPAGGNHVVFAVNDDSALGALRAATALGREGELLDRWPGS